jgi:thiol:disulfide interchange protein/DsbC/DsbD-like thiol-disulfide interchange protein
MLRALLLALLLLASPAFAASVIDNPHTRVELIAGPATPGSATDVGVVLTPKPGWHTYWLNPGDAGITPRATWSVPAKPLRFPLPGTLLVSGMMNYVYEARAVLLTSVTAPPTGTPLTLKLDYLVCSETLCVPESAALTLPLSPTADAAVAAQLTTARAALPKPVDWPVHYAVSRGRFILDVPLGNANKVKSAYFFANDDGAVDYAALQKVSIAGDHLRIETKAAGTPAGPIRGVLKLTRAGDSAPIGFALTAAPGKVAAAGIPIIDTGDRAAAGWPLFASALLLAIAGGVLLNVMPCVFPILSLKALSLAKEHTDEVHARADALAYAAGVITLCTAMGAIILGLRAAGSQIGWAFQLQDPRVIVALLLLMTAIALNLAGLFELRLSTGNAGASLAARPGSSGSFWTGALAALVATPCTGPFMAGALGAALVLPPIAGLLVFAGLGLGLALPFLLLGFVPALRKRLPKPGAWMERMRRILAVPMLLTAAALAWVLDHQAGMQGLLIGLAAAAVLTIALWRLGVLQRTGADKRDWRPIGVAVIASFGAVLLVNRMPAVAALHADAPGELAALPFDAVKLDALREQGKPAFVYFTADWCLTCKVNERGALSDHAVARAFDRAGVTVMVGDWTNGDEAIGRFLDTQGRAGVPLYLYYGRDGHVTELPQILTADALTALVS